MLSPTTDYKYFYQEQERQDELGLNWDSFKYRNYDYATGRFMSVDPLAEKYAYNATYAFQENKMGLGRELEGLELEVRDENTGVVSSGPVDLNSNPNLTEVETNDEGWSEDLPAVTITTSNNTHIENLTNDTNVEENSSAGEILASGSILALEVSQADGPEPGPADVGGVLIELGTILYAGKVLIDEVFSKQIPTQPVISPAMPYYVPDATTNQYNPPNKAVDNFAHKKKKQSTGKSGLDRHDAQYTHGGKKRFKNPNQRKDAERRRNKGKRIN